MNKTIYIADDESALRLALEKTFQRAHWHTLVYSQGTDLLSAVLGEDKAKVNQSIVMLDYLMPSLTGLDAIRSIREAGLNPGLILMTANPDEEIEALSREQNFLLLRKPFDDVFAIPLIAENLLVNH